MPVKTIPKKYSINSIVSFCLLSLLFLVNTSDTIAKGHKKKNKGVENTMVVAGIRTANPGDTFVRVTFNESQRFYKLPNDANPHYMELLKQSEKNQTAVIVTRAKEESDIILEVKKAK